ncbi:holo-ACP synthase [Streptomyces sp. WAC04114]|uniref:holo-ACP synthase n=1 Tax=Streptomyces sp. WAC04114 TaxID=2867961 RepID=UPI001C8B0C5F|nr:4'-phosphopantetheinyl transferase superfamily protein [Streptomyces sp. WAC04114]MBX9363028.1 4'-phosphopantetheinyl transferase superfamily protein [Streptomyces sp. WAC04114]
MHIGIDVLGLGELDRLQTRPWFRRYTYATDELALADGFGRERAREFLAGRFAAKEAVLKVLGTGCRGGLLPRHICVTRGARTGPLVRLTGAAQRRAAEIGLSDLTVSIAHKGEYVVAVALGHGDHETASRAGDASVTARTVLEEIALRESARSGRSE